MLVYVQSTMACQLEELVERVGADARRKLLPMMSHVTSREGSLMSPMTSRGGLYLYKKIHSFICRNHPKNNTIHCSEQRVKRKILLSVIGKSPLPLLIVERQLFSYYFDPDHVKSCVLSFTFTFPLTIGIRATGFSNDPRRKNKQR